MWATLGAIICGAFVGIGVFMMGYYTGKTESSRDYLQQLDLMQAIEKECVERLKAHLHELGLLE